MHTKGTKGIKQRKSRSGTTFVYMPCKTVFSKFEDMMKYCRDEDIPLYVTLKGSSSAREHNEWVCTKQDVDELKRLENEYNIFTHMTPNYGQPSKCNSQRDKHGKS